MQAIEPLDKVDRVRIPLSIPFVAAYLRHVPRYTYQQIADIAGCSKQAVWDYVKARPMEFLPLLDPVLYQTIYGQYIANKAGEKIISILDGDELKNPQFKHLFGLNAVRGTELDKLAKDKGQSLTVDVRVIDSQQREIAIRVTNALADDEITRVRQAKKEITSDSDNNIINQGVE